VPINPARICHELSKHVPDERHRRGRHPAHAGMWDGRPCTICAPTRRGYCERRPSRLGRFPAGSAPSAGAPDRPVVTFTGPTPGFWYHIGDIEDGGCAGRFKRRGRWSTNNGGGQPVKSRGFRSRLRPGHPDRNRARERVDLPQGPISPHRGGRSGALGISPSEDPKALPRRWPQALAAKPARHHRRRHRHRCAGADRGGVAAAA